MKLFKQNFFSIFPIFICIIGCVAPAEPVEVRQLIQLKKFSFRVPSKHIACGIKLACLDWKVKSDEENIIVLRRDWPFLGNDIRRNTIIEISVNPTIYSGENMATQREKEAFVDAVFRKYEEDIKAGIDIWHRTMPAAVSLGVPPDQLYREILKIDGKTFYRLYWKTQKRALTLLPSYKVVEGAIYLNFSSKFDTDSIIFSFIFWEQYDSGLKPRDPFRQIKQIISTFDSK
jgi:hypothetical protein